jgi:hypothetical protein
MGAVAAILVAVGIIALIYSVMERAKAGRVNKTPFLKTGQASGTSGDVSVEGNVVCQQPLVAPFSGAPCLYYSIKCTAEWKEGDKHKSKEVSSDKVAARFAIDDGSGPVAVDASKGGSFDPTQTKRETKGTGLMGGITGKELMFGQYVVSTGALSMGTKYKVEEEILPMQQRLYVNGSSQGGAITTPGALRSLIISSKSRDTLLASALKTSKLAMMAGLGMVVVGGGLGVASRLMAPSEPTAATTATATAAEVAAAPAAPAATPAAAEPVAAEPVVPAVKMEDLKASPAAKKATQSASTATGAATATTGAKATAAAKGATAAPTATAAATGAATAAPTAAPKAAETSPTAAKAKAKPAASN